MLNIMRMQTKTIVLIIVSLIVPAFVLWGVGSAIVSRKANFAGTIFGDRVSIKDYNQSYMACEMNALLTYGDNYQAIAKYINLDELAWERMALIKEAHRKNIKVSDAELVHHIQNYPFFQHEGQFAKEKYYYVLSSFFRLTPEQFEQREKNTLLISKLTDHVRNGIIVTDQELLEEYQKLKDEMVVYYILFPYAQHKPTVEDTDPALKQFFDDNAAQFTAPPSRQIAYFVIRPESFSPNPVTDAEIDAYYQNNTDSFKVDPTNPDASEIKPFSEVKDSIRDMLINQNQELAAQQKATQISEALLDTPNAEQVSQNMGIPFTVSDYFSRFQAPSDIPQATNISAAAFTLAVGDTSDPIFWNNAYYVIHVLDEKEAHIPEFGTVLAQVRSAYLKEQARVLAKTEAQAALSAISEKMTSTEGSSFLAAAQSLGFEPVKTEGFQLESMVPGIGYSPEFNQQAFQLEAGGVSPVLLTPQGATILSPIEKVSVSIQDFDQDKEKDTIRERIVNQKRNLIFRTWMSNLKDDANISKNPKYFNATQNPAA